MKILIVSQVFFPENFIINNLCKSLIDKNHDVTIITGKPNYPSGKFYNSYGFFSKIKGNYCGATIYRLPILSRKNASSFNLILNYISFAIIGSFFALFLKKKFDFSFVFAVSPITSAFPAIVHKIFYKTKIYLWVLDLWPESVTVGNRVKSKTILNMLNVVVKFIYNSADRIYISSSFMRKSIKKYETKESSFDIQYFPNWIKDVSTNNKNFSDLIPDGFIVMLAGNIGASIDYLNIVKAAVELKNYKKIKFLILGSGSKENSFKEAVVKFDLEGKVIFLGRYPSEDMPSFYMHADLMLITLSDFELFSFTVPEKLQSYMSMKKAIVGMVNGETNKIITKSLSGRSVKSGDYISLAKNIVDLYKMTKDERKALGESGFKYAQKNFNLSKNINSLLN